MFSKKEEVKSIGNPAGIGKGTGFGLRERDRDGIGLGHYRLRARESSGSSAILQKTIRLCCEIECVMGQRVSFSLQDHLLLAKGQEITKKI